MIHWLHEWHMRRRIRAILRYNRKHPEQCINLQDLFKIAKPDTLHVTEFEYEGKRHVSVGYQPTHWSIE
jgi:hypothetical protein